MATTRAPAAFASWTGTPPTAPVAALISTLSPARTLGRSCRGRLSFARCRAGLLPVCDEVLDAFHGEKRGDDGDQDGRGLQRPAWVRNPASSTMENGAATSDPG